MICDPCKEAGSLNRVINSHMPANTDLQRSYVEYAKALHGKCPDINCTCQHFIGVSLRSDGDGRQ